MRVTAHAAVPITVVRIHGPIVRMNVRRPARTRVGGRVGARIGGCVAGKVDERKSANGGLTADRHRQGLIGRDPDQERNGRDQRRFHVLLVSEKGQTLTLLTVKTHGRGARFRLGAYAARVASTWPRGPAVRRSNTSCSGSNGACSHLGLLSTVIVNAYSRQWPAPGMEARHSTAGRLSWCTPRWPQGGEEAERCRQRAGSRPC